MGDHCFSVVLRSNGWIICEADYEIRNPYSHREYAVKVARILALCHWRNTGVPTAVRVSNTHGGGAWVDEVRYGSGAAEFGSSAQTALGALA